MRKKIITSVVFTVIFALIIVTGSFITLVNIKNIDGVKEVLSGYNESLKEVADFSKVNFEDYKIGGKVVRFTIINNEGEVLYDSQNKNLGNHKNREEVIDAFDKGNGYIVRYSETSGANLVYAATKINDNTVIRSSIEVRAISFFTSETFVYYCIISFVVFLLSLSLGVKLVRIIIYPVKELEKVTTKLSQGDLSKRAVVYNNDEIGALAKTFNNMADELVLKIKDSEEKQDKLEAILESMDTGVVAIDNEGKIMMLNSYVKEIFNLNDNMIGEYISEHIIDYDLLSFIRDLPDFNSKEIKLFHPQECEIRVKKAPIVSGSYDAIGIVVSVQDITDIKRLENMRSQFVANVSHELKTPLTSIKGFAETLKYVEDEETRSKFLDIINNESERLSKLIDDILVLSNIENTYKLDSEVFKPYRVISDIFDIVKNQADKKNISLIFENNYKGDLRGSKDKFLQLSLNLIENAIKYSNLNGEVKVSIDYIDKNFVMKVIDNGIGIPVSDLPRIFERFYRVDKSRTTRGTGLGLAIVKHIVKLFDGEIKVDSKLGKGSIFTVKIKNK